MLQGAQFIAFAINIAAAPLGIYAFIHALLQRSDAFTAADRMTKPAWLGITGGSAFILLPFFLGFFMGGTIFWLAALVAALVYIVDVRPSLIEVQGGGRGW